VCENPAEGRQKTEANSHARYLGNPKSLDHSRVNGGNCSCAEQR